jgi:hypothetical protein
MTTITAADTLSAGKARIQHVMSRLRIHNERTRGLAVEPSDAKGCGNPAVDMGMGGK